MLKHHLFEQVAGKQWEAMQREKKNNTSLCLPRERCLFKQGWTMFWLCRYQINWPGRPWARLREDRCSWSAAIGFSAFCIHHPSTLLPPPVCSPVLPTPHKHAEPFRSSSRGEPRPQQPTVLTQHFLFEENELVVKTFGDTRDMRICPALPSHGTNQY